MTDLSEIPSLDLFTLKVTTLITVIIVSFATLLAWRINRQAVGLRLFALGLLSLCFGSVLGLMRILLPGNAVLISCNAFMLAGMVAVAQGIRAARGFPALPGSVLAALTAAVSVFYFYWMYGQSSFGMRVGVMSVAFSLLSGDAAISMFRKVSARDRLIYWPTGFAFAFAAGYLAVRAVGALTGFYGASLMSPVRLELASTLCANAAYIGCAFGMLLASNTRLRCDAERMAQFDPLTNLPNRRYVLDRLLDAERRSLATGRLLGVVYLDLDGFKLINDTLGHATGDDLLRRVSAAMIRELRAGDCLGRIGGDEFLAVVESIASREDLTVIEERLRAAAEKVSIADDLTVSVRISSGAALFPADAHSAHDVMREADAAMYRAKRKSRTSESSLATHRFRRHRDSPVISPR
jgi:diguanylate cyclase (GGDEF)-like protein